MRRFGSASPRPTSLMRGHLILSEGRKPGVEESVYKDAGQEYGSFDSVLRTPLRMTRNLGGAVGKSGGTGDPSPTGGRKPES